MEPTLIIFEGIEFRKKDVIIFGKIKKTGESIHLKLTKKQFEEWKEMIV